MGRKTESRNARQLLGKMAMEVMMEVAKRRDPDFTKVWAYEMLRRLEPEARRVVSLKDPPASTIAEMRALFVGDMERYLHAA
jgi:hypothetical protein